MRELKFRAWLDEYKEYIYFGGDYKEPKGRWGRGRCALVGNNHIADLLSNEDDSRKWVHNIYKVECIEQYTGLKDKNGKEIYEGDIVVNTYYDDGEMYKVLWVDDSVAFGMESLDDMELYKLPLESLEVIGNIHENPELVGEE